MNISNIKLFFFPYKIWILIFLVLHVLEIVLIITPFSIQNWVFSEMGLNSNHTFGTTQFDGTIFKGSISHCISGCEGSYLSNMIDWCSYASQSEIIPALSICKMFTALYYSYLIYSIFQVISILFVVLQVIATIIYANRDKYLWLGKCATTAHLVSVYLGGVFWVLINQAGINNDCYVFPQNKQKVDLCVGKGPKTAFAVIGIITLFNVVYLNVLEKIDFMRKEYMNQTIVPDLSLKQVYSSVFGRMSLSSGVGLNIRRESDLTIRTDNLTEQYQVVSEGVPRTTTSENLDGLIENNEALDVDDRSI